MTTLTTPPDIEAFTADLAAGSLAANTVGATRPTCAISAGGTAKHTASPSLLQA